MESRLISVSCVVQQQFTLIMWHLKKKYCKLHSPISSRYFIVMKIAWNCLLYNYVSSHKNFSISPPLFYGTTATRAPWPHYWGFTITLRHTTLSRTPLDKWLARCRDLYLPTHNTHTRQTSIPPVGFKPTIPASELLQTRLRERPLGLNQYHLQNSIIFYPSQLTGRGGVLDKKY